MWCTLTRGTLWDRPISKSACFISAQAMGPRYSPLSNLSKDENERE
jgi:hypothetical protein